MGVAFRGRRARLISAVLAVCCVAIVVIGGTLALGWRPLGASPAASVTRPASADSTKTSLPGGVARASSTARAAPSASAVAPRPSPAADVAPAIASQSSWVLYKSKTYHFSILHPPDWAVSETVAPGWAVISGWDDSNVSITWRTIPRGTTLAQVTDEVWKAMHDAGFTVDASVPGIIAGLPAQMLTLNGMTVTGHARHGIIGIVTTATARYRLELWTRPGSEADDATLYNAFLWTFQPK